MCSQRRSGKSKKNTGKSNFPGNESVFCKFSRSEQSAHAGAEFVCGNGLMDWKPCNDIGGKGNESAAACYRINETC